MSTPSSLTPNTLTCHTQCTCSCVIRNNILNHTAVFFLYKIRRFVFLMETQTSLVVWWSELLTTNHEVPGSIPGSTTGIFPCRGRIPVVTMVWVVSRIRLKFETSITRSHNSISSDWIHDRDLLAGGDLTTRDSQHNSS